MKRKILKGKEILLEDSDWEALVKRFDASNAVLLKGTGLFRIDVPCSLCLRYSLCNEGCPFRQFAKIHKYVGCKMAIKKILREKLAFGMCTESLTWDIRKNKEARKQLNKIYDVLLSFETVKKKEKEMKELSKKEMLAEFDNYFKSAHNGCMPDEEDFKCGIKDCAEIFYQIRKLIEEKPKMEKKSFEKRADKMYEGYEIIKPWEEFRLSLKLMFKEVGIEVEE